MNSGFIVELAGDAVGILVGEGGTYEFHAVDPRFRVLEGATFDNGFAAERAVRRLARHGAGKPVQARTVPHAASGVLELRLARELPPQEIHLAFDYEAPFNRQLEGLYKVTVGDDAYAVTQMEPVSARFAHPLQRCGRSSTI